MKCQKCGHENSELDLICSNCGEVLNDTALSMGKKSCPRCGTSFSFGNVCPNCKYKLKKKSVVKLKKSLISVLCVVLVVAIVILAVNLAEEKAKINYSAVTDTSTGCIVVSCGSEILTSEIPGTLSSSLALTYDSTVCALASYDLSSGTFGIYKISTTAVYLIGNSLSSSFCLAADGENIAYTDLSGNLYIGSENNSKEISSDVSSYAISPNGKTVIYSDSENSLYCYNSVGGSVLVGEMFSPVAVSNGGKYIFAISTEDDRLYLIENKDSSSAEVIASSLTGPVYFNRNNTKMIFTTELGTYFYEAGSQRRLLFDGFTAQPCADVTYSLSSSGQYLTLNEKNLTEQYYVLSSESSSSSALCYLDSDFAKTTICDDISLYSISDNKKIVTFLTESDDLYISKADDFTNTLIAEDVVSFDATITGKYIYYITSSGEIYQYKNSSQLLASNVSDVLVSAKGYIFYTSSDGAVLYGANGSDEPVIICESLYRIFMSADSSAVSYYTLSEQGAYEKYASDGDLDFVLISSNVYYNDIG